MTAVADPTIETVSAPAETEAPIDLSAFNDALSDAISENNGKVTDEDMVKVRRAYGELEPRRGKSAARAALTEEIRLVVDKGELLQAQALFAVQDAIQKSGGLKGRGGASTPKNTTESHINAVLAIQLGYSLAYANAPQNVDADWTEKLGALVTPELEAQAATYRTWLKGDQEGDEPEVPEAAKQGARISVGRAPKGQGRKPGKSKGDAPVAENPAAGALDGTPAGTAPAADAGTAPEGWE